LSSDNEDQRKVLTCETNALVTKHYTICK